MSETNKIELICSKNSYLNSTEVLQPILSRGLECQLKHKVDIIFHKLCDQFNSPQLVTQKVLL